MNSTLGILIINLFLNLLMFTP